MRKTILLATLLAAACGVSSVDVEGGPVILQCDGQLTTVALTSNSQSYRYTFRIDGKAKTFEVFDDDKGKFDTWGDGSLSITSSQITYVATIADGGVIASRTLKFDRSSGEVHDKIDVNIGGTNTFSGSCKPVSEPQPLEKQF